MRGRTLQRADGVQVTLVFGEALMLMKYANKAGQVEWLWNSRDGVTPFGLGEGLSHADWGEDAFVPNFVPPVGMRVFVSWKDAPASTKAELSARWAERIKTFEAQGYSPPDEVRQGEPFGLRPHDPCVVVVDEALRAHFEALARENPFVQGVR